MSPNGADFGGVIFCVCLFYQNVVFFYGCLLNSSGFLWISVNTQWIFVDSGRIQICFVDCCQNLIEFCEMFVQIHRSFVVFCKIQWILWISVKIPEDFSRFLLRSRGFL